MIENLNGIHETVNYKENTNIRLYLNTVCENYPSHWHTPLEIIMPLENNYTIICNNCSLEINPYEIVVICPGVIHTLKAPEKGKRIIFQAEVSMLKEIRELYSVLSFIHPIALITSATMPEVHDILSRLLLEIKDEYFHTCSLSEAFIYSRLISMFVVIGRNHIKNLEPDFISQIRQQEYISKFLGICEYINNHCNEDLTLDQLSAMAGYSKYHFSRLFKQFTNVSFYKYVNQKRIAQAESLLINPEISVTEVAIRSGFSSPSAFIRMFKIIKDCTPTEFRSIYRKP